MTHNGWTITWCPWRRTYEAIGPNYEPTWLGGEDGWQDDDANRIEADTIEEIIAEISCNL